MKLFNSLQDIEFYNIDRNLSGHIFAYGRIGSGKSVSLKSIIEGYQENKNYKIFDVWGGDRLEHLFWCLPSQNIEYWKKLQALGTFSEPGPKQFKVNLLYPSFLSTMPKKLPKKSPFVISKIFSIPLKDINVSDISMVTGNLSSIDAANWENIIYNATKSDNCASLTYLMKKIKASQKTRLYKSFIETMIREGFLMNKNNDANLDLLYEMKQKDVITLLCLEFVPKKFQLFVLNYFLRKLTELMDKKRSYNKNIIFFREASNFFKITDDIILEDRYKIFRSKMTDYLRMARRGSYFALDCQSPSEVKQLVQGSDDYTLIFKMTSWRDKQEATDELKRERRMLQAQINDLAFLEKGEVYIIETSKRARKVRIILCRSHYWSEDSGNFYNIWDRNDGDWKLTDDIKETIKNSVKERINFYDKNKKIEKPIVEVEPNINTQTETKKWPSLPQ